jgi:ADP-heptose:LPS heptosyltransferase
MFLLKAIQSGFRRLPLFILRLMARPRHAIPSDLDFNQCKFLFLRQDLIGDALVSTPVFESLKRHYPGAVIDVFMSPRNHFVLERDPAVRKRWIYRKSPGEIRSLMREVRHEHYDLMVDLIDNPSRTSTLWCMFGGARWRVGLAKENDFCYDVAAPFLPKDSYHVAERTANVLKVFRINPEKESLRVRYFFSQNAERFGSDVWKDNGLDGHTVVGVNISAGDEVRSWWGNNAIEFLAAVHARHLDWRILLVFKPEDRAKADLLSLSSPFVILSPNTPSFDHVAALVSRLSFLVTPDTSIVQIAAAFNVPALVLHLKVSSIHGHLWEPYKSDSENLIASVDNVETIPSSEVIAAFERLSSRNINRKPKVQKSNVRSSS